MNKIVIAFVIIICCVHPFYGDVSAQGAVVIDVNSGRILYGKNMDAKLEMASTTKIMTALIAVESGKMDNLVTIKKEWCGIEGSSIYLKENDKYTLRGLVYGLMLRSGNDASVAIANYLGGSVENFVNIMNERASEIGAKNTHFTNPNGLPDLNHYTTAYDLALITAKALKQSEFLQVVSTKKIDIQNGTDNQIFINKNKLLWEYPQANGVKTGYTKRAGKCYVASAKRNDLFIACVVINCPNMWADAKSLMDETFYNYQNECALNKENFLDSVSIKNGKKTYSATKPKENFFYPLKKDGSEKIVLKYSYSENHIAPITPGTKAGAVEIYLNDKKIGTVDIVYVNSIDSKSIPYYFFRLLKNL